MLSFAFVVFSALAGVAPQTTRAAPMALEKPEVAAARVAACGFKNARLRFDASMQEDVVDVPEVTSVSAEQLRCVALASLASSYYVTFPPQVEREYQPLYWRLSDEQDKAAARVWLEKRGLLSRLPTFDPAQSDETSFAHRLERLCGPKATGTLQPMRGMATFKEGALGTLTKRGISKGKLDDETLMCLLHASAASGYPLGFIGNAAYEQPH